MMNKLKSAKINLLRFLFVLPLLATILLAFRKQIGENHKPNNDTTTAVLSIIQDTMPIVTPFSDRRYNIEVFINNKKDNPLIIVSDKNKKEITRLTMDEWNSRKDYYDKLYGHLPPPPPPMAPTPPTPMKLPATVQKININNDKATVWLKNGSKENYDLTIPDQKEKFENKYGEIIPPPPPPARTTMIEVPAAVSLSEMPVAVPVLEERKVQAVNGAVTITEKPVSISISGQGNPLYVLDGAIINKATLDNINPETIASVDVMKGNSAMALYGDKGSEGVIRITTKGASTTDKVTYTANEVRQSATDNNSITLKFAEIEMKNSKELILLDGKELPAERRKLSGTFNLVTLNKEEATKKYGDKGKNGAMEITTIN